MENLDNPCSDNSLVDNEISEINLDATSSRNYDEDNNNNNNNNNNSFFTCEICVEIVPLNSKFENIETICSHNYCTNCIAKYIQVKVSQDNIVVLDTLSCRSILSENVFKSENDGAVRLLESSKVGLPWSYLPSYGRSYCPYRDCSELILNECVESNGSNKVTKSNCPNCKKLFCFHCMVPWKELQKLFCFHCMVPWKENHRCVDRNECVIDIDSNDVLFIENAKLNKWVRCPSCYHYVERNQGCNTIVCRCKTVFCYNCGKKVCICSFGPLCEILLICICLLVFWPIIGLYCLYHLIHWGAGKLSTYFRVPAPDHKLAGGINTGKPQQQKTQAALQEQPAPPTRH
ncbi:hypothetical protein MKX03_024137 [Papaver bracteatum]|nr:hypothetical protein MKX03_024137 [Papaver bracteatum]